MITATRDIPALRIGTGITVIRGTLAGDTHGTETGGGTTTGIPVRLASTCPSIVGGTATTIIPTTAAIMGTTVTTITDHISITTSLTVPAAEPGPRGRGADELPGVRHLMGRFAMATCGQPLPPLQRLRPEVLPHEAGPLLRLGLTRGSPRRPDPAFTAILVFIAEVPERFAGPAVTALPAPRRVLHWPVGTTALPSEARPPPGVPFIRAAV